MIPKFPNLNDSSVPFPSEISLEVINLQKEANNGDPIAQYELGMRYKNGQGVAPSHQEAAKWFEKAAIQGHPEAQCELGHLHLIGQGVLASYQEAKKYFKQVADHYFSLEQFKKALEMYEMTLDIEKRISNEENPAIAMALERIGECFGSLSNYEMELEKYREALKIWKMIYPKGHENVARALNKVGYRLQLFGLLEEALICHEEALEIQRTVWDTDNHPEIADSLHNLGETHRWLEYFGEANHLNHALKYYQRCLEVRTRIDSLDDPSKLIEAFHQVGRVLTHLGRFTEARKCYEDALEVSKKIYGPVPHCHVMRFSYEMGLVLEQLGYWEEALKYYLEVLEMQEKVHDATYPHILDLLKNIGDISIKLGQFKNASHFLNKALEKKKQLLSHLTSKGVLSRPTNDPFIACILSSLGDVSEGLGHFKKAIEYHDEALEINKRIYGLVDLSVAILLHKKGQILHVLGDFDKANQYYQEALEISKKKDDRSARSFTLNLLYHRGKTLEGFGHFDEARQCYQEALELSKQIYPSFDHPRIASILTSLANVSAALNQFKKGQEYQQEAQNVWLKIWDESNKMHLSKSTYHFNVATALTTNTGDSLMRLGCFEEALQYYQHCLGQSRKMYSMTYKAKHKYSVLASLLNKATVALRRLGRFEEALIYAYKTLKMNRKIYGLANHYQVSISLNNIGDILEELGRFDEALKYHQEALEMDRKGYQVETHYIVDFLNKMGKCLGSLGKFKEALEIHQQALIKAKSFYGEIHTKVSDSFHGIGICLYSLGNHEEALKNYEQALAILKQVFSDNILLHEMSNTLAALGRVKEALDMQKKLIEIIKNKYDQEHPSMATCLSNMGAYLFSLNEVEEALHMYEQCLAIRQKVFGPRHPKVMLTLTCMDTCLYVLGRTMEQVEEKDAQEGRLSKADFQMLIDHASHHLRNRVDLILEKNPSGFIRIRFPVPKDFRLADQIETLRLHYWPPGEIEIDVVEALHNHPRYFESMILHGGYTHALYKQIKETSSPNPFRIHRIVKIPNDGLQKQEERTIFCLGTANLEYLSTDEVQENSIVNFPKNLIHQVISYQPATLTINAVFKGQKDMTYFNIYMPGDNHLDPQREREFLTLDESSKIVPKIENILHNWTS